MSSKQPAQTPGGFQLRAPLGIDEFWTQVHAPQAQAAHRAKIEAQQAERRIQLEAYQQQLEADKAARDAGRAEHQALVARAQARREALARGELAPIDPASIPRLVQCYQQQRIQNDVQQKERQIEVASAPHAFYGQGMKLPSGSPLIRRWIQAGHEPHA